MEKLENKLWTRKEQQFDEVTLVDVALTRMLELWGDRCAENVFKVCWLVETQIKEMKAAGWTEEAAKKELCDIIFICARELAALGFDIGETLIWRLGVRHEGQIDEIHAKYEQMFLDEFGPTRAALEEVLG